MAETTGYTLPVWVAAAAKAALLALRGEPFKAEQQLVLEAGEAIPVAIPVVAASSLGAGRALAVARCEPGEGLDLTRGLVVWAEVSWWFPSSEEVWLQIDAGEGAGIHAATGELCLSPSQPRCCSLIPDSSASTEPESRATA